MTFTSKPLTDLLTATKDGDWGYDGPTAEHSPFYVIRGADFPAVRVGNIDQVPLRYLADKTVHRRRLQANDILLETAGGTLDRPTGRTLLVTQALLDQFDGPVTCASFARFLRVDPAIVDAGYLFWYLQSVYAAGETFEYQVQHTGVARFQYTAFSRRKQIPLPALNDQQGIAEVLGALDDKITTNTSLAATALGLADTMFLASVRAATFSSATFADLARISGGGTPSTKADAYWDGDIAWATPTDVTGLRVPYLESTLRRITRAGLAACSSDLHPPRSILMTSRATIGVFAIAQQPTAVNQGFIVVNAMEPTMQWWLFHEMRSRVSEFLSYANGATFLELSRGNFRKLPVRLADKGTMREFAENVEVLHQRARVAMVEANHLALMRDALLPQLMSGKLQVKHVEQMVGNVV